MLGGSLILTWDDWEDGLADSGAYPFSNSGATLNAVRLVLRDRTASPPVSDELRLRRKNGMPLGIVVDLAGASDVRYTTDAGGKNLKISRTSTGDLTSFIKHSKFTMEHPDHEKKLTRLAFSNVGVNGTAPTGCIVTGTNVVCNIDPSRAIRTRLILRVCRGITCPNPQP